MTSAFLIDECVARPVVLALRDRFGDVVSVAETAPGTSDLEVLNWATRDARILLTEDYDFGGLAVQKMRPAHGIVIIGPGVFRGDRSTSAERIADRISKLTDTLAGRLTILEQLRTRQRDL